MSTVPITTTPASYTTTTTSSSQPNPAHQVDKSLQYLIILHIESTHDGAHPGDPTSGKIDDLILPVADPMHHHHTNSSPTLIPSTCPAPPPIPSVPIDQADILSVAYCVYHLASDKVVHRHLHLCTPQSMPLTPYCEARSGISNSALKPTLSSLTNFFQTLQASLMQFGFDHSKAASSKFAFLSYNAFNLRLLLPSECRRKQVDIPAFLNQPTYLLLTQEVQKWMCHHPDSAHDLASFALRDLCYYFRAKSMQGVPISRLPYAGQCLRFTANFDMPKNLQLLDHTPNCHNFTTPSRSPSTTNSPLPQQPDHHLLLPSPLHRCESIANLVRALREYAYSDVLTTPINAQAGMLQFEIEKSTFINLSGLPRSPSVPTHQDLLAWFHNHNLYPIKLLMLVTRARAPTGDGFVEFASHHEAKSALSMNGRVFLSRQQDTGKHSPTSTLGLIEVAASSPIVLHHAKEFLVPFPSRVVDSGQCMNLGLSGSALGTSWTCAHCTFHNFSSKRTCLKCNNYTSPHVLYTNQLNTTHAYGTPPSRQYNGNKPIAYRSTGAPPGLSFSDPVALAMGEGVMSSNNHSSTHKRPPLSNGHSVAGHVANHPGMSARSQWPCDMCGTHNFQHGTRSSCSYCGTSRSKAYYDNQMTNPTGTRLSQSPSNESYQFGHNDPNTSKSATYIQGQQDASQQQRRGPNVHNTSRYTGAPHRPTVNANRNTHRHLNNNNTTQCSNHHGSKPVRPGDWICPVLECQFQNFASRAVCLKCGVASPTPPQAMCPVPFRMGDWLCFACTAHNFASRINCVRCGCTKVYSLSTKNATSLEIPRTTPVVGSSYKSDSAVDIFKIPPFLNTPTTYSKSVGSTRPRRHTLSSNPPSLSLV